MINYKLKVFYLVEVEFYLVEVQVEVFYHFKLKYFILLVLLILLTLLVLLVLLTLLVTG
jgi:hypothetical protein